MVDVDAWSALTPRRGFLGTSAAIVAAGSVGCSIENKQSLYNTIKITSDDLIKKGVTDIDVIEKKLTAAYPDSLRASSKDAIHQHAKQIALSNIHDTIARNFSKTMPKDLRLAGQDSTSYSALLEDRRAKFDALIKSLEPMDNAIRGYLDHSGYLKDRYDSFLNKIYGLQEKMGVNADFEPERLANVLRDFQDLAMDDNVMRCLHGMLQGKTYRSQSEKDPKDIAKFYKAVEETIFALQGSREFFKILPDPVRAVSNVERG